MFKKTIVYILISCFVFSPVFAISQPTPGSFNVKVEYIYTDGDRMIVSWNEGKEKHTLFPVKEGNDPINLPNYYKTGELYPASNPTTQMRVYDNSNNPHLFNLDANASTAQTAPKSAQTDQTTYHQQQNDDVDLNLIVTIGCAVVLILVLGWLWSGH
jgi:hypothetical protein